MRPILHNIENTPLGPSYISLLCPTSLIILNIFIGVFDAIINCYAELSTFGDRLFYLDFWNSTNFDEWSRKWNRQVHEFLKEYVYMYVSGHYKLSQAQAYTVTLIFSAVLHEFVLVF